MSNAWAVDRSPHGLVVVSGPDGTSFLQNLVSQDLDPVAVGESTSSLLLTPQGKLDVLFRATRVEDATWWLDTEADFGPRLAASLTRFKIRIDAEIEDRTADTGMATVVGGRSTALSAGVAMQTPWGFDAVGPRDMVATVVESARERRSLEAWEAFRIEAGMPRLGVDVDEKTIPQEAFLERDAVAFEKGCFLGQELVARIDSRGHVNRYLRRVEIDGETVPPAGASVHAGEEKPVGNVTSAAAVPGERRVVALAMIRREVDPPADVTLRWDGGEAPARVLA
jgi:folate-binding protein YgfZ